MVRLHVCLLEPQKLMSCRWPGPKLPMSGAGVYCRLAVWRLVVALKGKQNVLLSCLFQSERYGVVRGSPRTPGCRSQSWLSVPSFQMGTPVGRSGGTQDRTSMALNLRYVWSVLCAGRCTLHRCGHCYWCSLHPRAVRHAPHADLLLRLPECSPGCRRMLSLHAGRGGRKCGESCSLEPLSTSNGQASTHTPRASAPGGTAPRGDQHCVPGSPSGLWFQLPKAETFS